MSDTQQLTVQVLAPACPVTGTPWNVVCSAEGHVHASMHARHGEGAQDGMQAASSPLDDIIGRLPADIVGLGPQMDLTWAPLKQQSCLHSTR